MSLSCGGRERGAGRGRSSRGPSARPAPRQSRPPAPPPSPYRPVAPCPADEEARERQRTKRLFSPFSLSPSAPRAAPAGRARSTAPRSGARARTSCERWRARTSCRRDARASPSYRTACSPSGSTASTHPEAEVSSAAKRRACAHRHCVRVCWHVHPLVVFYPLERVRARRHAISVWKQTNLRIVRPHKFNFQLSRYAAVAPVAKCIWLGGACSAARGGVAAASARRGAAASGALCLSNLSVLSYAESRSFACSARQGRR